MIPADRKLLSGTKKGYSNNGGVLLWLLPWLLLVFSVTVQSQSTSESEAANATTITAPVDSTAARINELSELIKQRTDQRDSLRELIIASGPNANEGDRQKLKAVSEDIESLRESFLFALLGNQTDMQALEDVEEADTTWQEDVVEVLEPLADTLKAVTRRPREIAELRGKIAQAGHKSAAIQSAINAANQVEMDPLSEDAANTLQNYLGAWAQDLEQVTHDRLLAESQLESLETNNDSGWSGVWASTKQFFLGRGLTLLLAIAVAVIAWLIMRYLWWLYSTKIASKETRRHGTLFRFSAYSYYLFTGLIVIIAVLYTLWIREDLLLLALTFVALASLALGFRQYLPNYITEARLLLNLGTVREGERVMFNGLPWQVMSLNIQSVLRNPAIDGVIRLPLSTLADLSSRPIKNNLWFPTKQGDYVFLPDGLFGRVKHQTPDIVELSVKGGVTLTYPTAEFFSLKVLNLSGDETFGVSTTFGLDYSLQPICMTTVPAALRTAIHEALVSAGYEKHVKGEMVELSSAGDSSLDYVVYVTMSSELASQYYAIERLLVQTCIDVANSNGWSIPFPQLAVHSVSST